MRQHFLPQLRETVAVAHEVDSELDVGVIGRRNERVHFHVAQDPLPRRPRMNWPSRLTTGRPDSIAWITC
jgi:hypothetical protein